VLFGRRHLAANVRPLDFESVYRDHFEFVYRKAARIGGPSIDPEDAAQEVFMVVERRLETFDGSSLITTWLYGITLNVVRTMRRKAQRHLALDIHDLPLLAAPERADRAELREAYKIAYEILDQMAPKKREAFILAELEGLSCEEIASVVDTKVATVWSRVHYARKEFSERLGRRQKKQLAAPLKLAFDT
jgi:RNA polymerase sigma-70 factor (ECF subfamily)